MTPRVPFGAALLAALAIAPLAAQTVPDVSDVYSSSRPRSKLGPAVTPQRVLDEGVAVLNAAKLLSYEASVTRVGNVSGTVLLGRSEPGPFDRFRVTLRGETANGEKLLTVVGSDGRGFFALDLLAKTVRECERWEELGPVGELARGLLLPELGHFASDGDAGDRHLFKFPAPEEIAGELCYVVHFPEEAEGDHVYVALSVDDGLPRRVERVSRGPDGLPVTIALDVSNLKVDPLPPAEAFAPFIPDGFRRL